MNSFITRVELHGATYTDYETLHAAMQRVGFSPFIVSSSGHRYHLPTAEYYISGNHTQQTVLNAAKGAAATTRKTYAVLVTGPAQCTWEGLQQA